MATLQEAVNWAANSGRRPGGVSVYSPLRPVRPQGTLANSGTARRILQRQQPANWLANQPIQRQRMYEGLEQGGGQRMELPAYQPPEQPSGSRTALDDILEGIQPSQPQAEQEEPGGWRGVLGTVVNSWPAKVIMAPLNVLDIPRRAVVSTVNEVADVFNGGDASWEDWFDQVKDPSFGFGSVVGSTGNLWADRFIGFAGDVLLDPLTYVAGAGVWSGTGRAMRQRLAALAVSEGLSEDVVRSIGRYGLAELDNSVRTQLRQAATRLGDEAGEQILDRGYYFKVPFRDTFQRLPGTAKLDELLAPVFAQPRRWLAESRLGTTLRSRLRSPEIMREATEKLITGRGTMGFNDAAAIYIYANAQRQLGNTAQQRFYAEAAKLTKSVNNRELANMVDIAETQGGTRLNELFARAAKLMQDAGINFYPRKNYVPHILSQGAIEWFRAAGEQARRFREALIPGLDLDNVSPRLMERHLTAGTVAEFGPEGAKRTFNAGAGTLKDINAEFRRVFPELKFKLFEDDPAIIFARYGQHFGDDMGRAGGLKTLLNSKTRLVRLRSDEDMVKTLIDEESLTLLNKQTADMLRADHRALTDRITRLRQDQLNDTRGLQGVLGVHMRDVIDELENVEPALKTELDDLIRQEAGLATRAGRTSVMTGEAPASNIGVLEIKLQDAYTRLEARAHAADQRLAELQEAAVRERVAWESMQRMFGVDVGLMSTPKDFTALRDWNIVAAEAASLAMDRQAVSELRLQLAELIRKANLAEAAADNPAQVAVRAGLTPLPEERITPQLVLSADGRYVTDIVGPTSGRVRGTRAWEEEQLYLRDLEEYKARLEEYQGELKYWEEERLPAWEARKAADPNGFKDPPPKKPVPPKRPERQLRMEAVEQRMRWSLDDEVHTIVTQANEAREKAINDLVRLDITPRQLEREALRRDLLPPEAEADLLERWMQARELRDAHPAVRAEQQATRTIEELNAAKARIDDQLRTLPRTAAGDRRAQAVADARERLNRETTESGRVWDVEDGKIVLRRDFYGPNGPKALALYETYARRLKARKGRRIAADEATENEIARLLGYGPSGERTITGIMPAPRPRTQAAEQARYQLRQAEDQLEFLRRTPGVKDRKERIRDLSARVDEMRETVARHEAERGVPTPATQTHLVENRTRAIAEMRQLSEHRASLERDLKLVSEGPKGKRDPVRVRLEEESQSLGRRIVQAQNDRVAAQRENQAVMDAFEQLDAQVQKQRNTYRQLQERVPNDTREQLTQLNQRVLNKQAQLAEDERRVARLIEIHRDNIDRAEQRVEAAVNLDKELRMREREMWGTDEGAIRAARRQVEEHRNFELHVAKQDYADAQKPIERARARYAQTKAELAGLKDELARQAPPTVGMQIRQANSAEATLLRQAEVTGTRVGQQQWRIFPEIDAPPRRPTYTYEQRDRLKELYDLVHNTHPVDRAGSGGSYLVRQALETLAAVSERGGPKGPKDVAAMNEAARVLAAHRRGELNTAAHERYRAALEEINAIERSVAKSPTYAQSEFGDVRRIGEMLGELEEIRIPFQMPGKGSKRWKAIAASPRTPGGDRSVLARAKENHTLATDWIDNFSQDLIDSGAIEESQREFIARQRDEVKKMIDVYTHRKTPDVQSEMLQVSNDLGRLVDIMLSYQASLAYYEPSVQLGTAIAAHRILRERTTLTESIEELEKLVKIKPEERVATFKKEIEGLEAKIEREQKIIDNPETDPAEVKRATERRNYARRQLGKKIDAGVIMPGSGDLRGVINDDIDSMTDIIMHQLAAFDDASNDLRSVTHWRDVYVTPIETRRRLEANRGRYELELEELELSRKRLQREIAASRRAGRDTVTYTPTKSYSFTQTISQAERRVEATKRSAVLQQLFADIESPLDQGGYNALEARQRQIYEDIKRRGGTELPEERDELELIQERIELALGGPPTRERRLEMLTELQEAANVEHGILPKRMLPVVENEIRIAERRQSAAQQAAAAQGRRGELAERQLSYSYRGQAKKVTKGGKTVNKTHTMSLDEAEAELARYSGYRQDIETVMQREQRQLATMNGTSQQRVSILQVLISDAEAPLNEAGIRALKGRARQIDNAAGKRPGRSLAEKRLPEEQRELDLIAARIEQAGAPQDPERLARMQTELAQLQEDITRYHQAMSYDYELMGNVEDNGYRLMRELTENLRTPTKAEARMLRALIGPQLGQHATEVLAALDDFIVGNQIAPERWSEAIDYIRRYSMPRASEDALDRVISEAPVDEFGRALTFEELTRATQAEHEIQSVLAGGGRVVQKTVDPEGFREQFFQTLIEEARARRQDAEREIRHFVGWLDMAVAEDITSTVGIVNKYFGGKIRPYGKKERTARQRAGLPSYSAEVRRRDVVKATITEALMKMGYDPALTLERRLREAKSLRSRLDHYLRGLGVILVDQTDDVEEVMRWWDNAALGEIGTVESLQGLAATLRSPDEIAALARARVAQLKREISKANKAGDTELSASLAEELNTISAGRYLPTEQQRAEVVANATTSAKQRRKAEPSEIAANKLDTPPDPEELNRLRTEVARAESRQRDTEYELQQKNDELRALNLSIAEAESPTPVAAQGDTVDSVMKELSDYAASVRKQAPEGKITPADMELARARSTAYAQSFPGEMTPEQEAELIRLSDEVLAMSALLWRNTAIQKKAEAIYRKMPTPEAQVRSAVSPDVQAEMVNRATALRKEIKALENQAEELATSRTGMQQRIDDLDKDHAARTSDGDPTKETPSMLDDPVAAEQAEGLPPEGAMTPERAPTHLIEDAIYDTDASPEDLLKEYSSVIAQTRALLKQYGSYADMPPDVRRSAGELANRAQVLSQRRQEMFVKATAGFTEGDQARFVETANTMAQAANPSVDLDWWTAVSTGTPPASMTTSIMRGTGVSRRGVVTRQMRTELQRGSLPGRGYRRSTTPPGPSVVTRAGRRRAPETAEELAATRAARIAAGQAPPMPPGTSMWRNAPKIREQVLRGTDIRGTKIKVRRRDKAGRLRTRTETVGRGRPLTRQERKIRQWPAYSAAERDLRGIAERARAGVRPIEEQIAEAEASIAEREAQFVQATQEYGQGVLQERAENIVAQQAKLNHANDAAAQAQRNVQRIEGQRERINDAYTRALEAENVQLGEVRRRAIEVKLDHEAAARTLELYEKAMREPKNSGLGQLYSDIHDLLEYKRSVSAPEPIALGPIGSAPAASPIEVSSLQPEVRQIEALLAAAADQQRQIDQLDLHGGVIAKRLRDFDKAPKKNAFFTEEQLLQMSDAQQGNINAAFRGALSESEAKRFEDVIQHVVADGWQAVAEDMFTGPDALVIANSLQTAMDNIRRTIREPGFWKVVEKYTAFFSTYATARPGFHVRNAMSGTFMNMVDGVKIRHMRRAPRMWHDFVSDPEGFWDRASPDVRNAFMAVFGSGAGGQFQERGLTEAVTAGGKAYKLLMNNWITKMNRKAGAYVEGPMRLAMALDSIGRGQSVNAALDRITKFHFDYTQLSELDVVARRMIPFWTFMSRNLPLQIEQMWLRPRTYLQYQSLVRNFGEEMNPLTPDYWLSQGAFTLDPNADEGEPWYLAPDLPHLRVAEPLTALSQGDLGRAALSDINPLFLAPVEAFAAGKKFYTGAEITDEPRPPQGAENSMMWLYQLLGGTSEGASGQQLVDPRYAHVGNSLLPPIEWLNRLLSNEGTREGRQGETVLRSLGAPVYKLTEKMQQQTARNRYYDALDAQRRQQLLARS